MSKKLPKHEIIAASEGLVELNPHERKIFNLISSASARANYNDETPYVVLKYFRDAFECFSTWEKPELKEFTEFLKELKKRTWSQVLETSGKIGGKRGLAYTPYDISDIEADGIRDHFKEVRKEISDDINFFELRVNQNKLRVHGFRAKAAFFLVLLDREHRVFPE